MQITSTPGLRRGWKPQQSVGCKPSPANPCSARSRLVRLRRGILSRLPPTFIGLFELPAPLGHKVEEAGDLSIQMLVLGGKGTASRGVPLHGRWVDQHEARVTDIPRGLSRLRLRV